MFYLPQFRGTLPVLEDNIQMGEYNATNTANIFGVDDKRFRNVDLTDLNWCLLQPNLFYFIQGPKGKVSSTITES